MKMYRCLYPSCSELLNNSGYCPKHKAWADANKVKPFANAKRSNTDLYRTPGWKQLRALVLKEQPYCVQCGKTKNLTVHHIKAPRGNPALFFARNNLVTICVTCHRYITQKEIAERNADR